MNPKLFFEQIDSHQDFECWLILQVGNSINRAKGNLQKRRPCETHNSHAISIQKRFLSSSTIAVIRKNEELLFIKLQVFFFYGLHHLRVRFTDCSQRMSLPPTLCYYTNKCKFQVFFSYQYLFFSSYSCTFHLKYFEFEWALYSRFINQQVL